MEGNSNQLPIPDETGYDVSQVNIKSSISGDSGESDGNVGVSAKRRNYEVGGDYDNDDDESKTEENLETEKDLSYGTSEMENDSSKDDGIENESRDSPMRDDQLIGTMVNNHTSSAINSVPDNASLVREVVTIDKTSYDKLISEQKRLTDELKRLKDRLITVEDDYTSEILELEDRESKTRNELNQALETIDQLKNCIKEVDQPNNWSERMEQLKAERDAALDDVSKLDDKVHRLTASVTNLQLVIEQIQKENEKKVTSLTKQHLAALESERTIQNDLRQEMEKYEKKSMESAQALEAATRLTENIDKQQEMIQNLKQELCDKEKQISDLEVDKANLKSSFEGKVDKQVIKNLILGYFGTPNDKKHEVERLLARVLDFNEQEMIRAGLSFGRPSNKFGLDTLTSSGSSIINQTSNPAAAGSILLAPLQSTPSTGNQHPSSALSTGTLSSASSSTSLYSNEPTSGIAGSLSKMFVEFLEAESRPKGTPTNAHPTSSLTRELARDLTKVALTPNNKSHSFLEPASTIGASKVIPAPISSTSASLLISSSPGLQQSIGNHISQANIKQPTNPLITSTPSISTSSRISSPFSGNLHGNPIRPVSINSSNNILESDSSTIPSVSMSKQYHKSPSLSSTSSSSSLILSNPMPTFTNAIKPITFDAISHTQPPQSSYSSLSSSTTIITPTVPATISLPQVQPITAQPPTSLSSLLLSENSSHLKSSSPSSLMSTHPPSTTNTISPVASSSLLLAGASTTSSSDFNSILSNSHLKVKK